MEETNRVSSEGNTDISKGAIIFRQRCETCHSFIPGETTPKEGPNLHGVFGRKVASADDYHKFSLASQYKDITWTEDTLFQFLEQPKKFIPGTKMLFKGLQSEQQRRDLISYLKDATK